MGWDWKDIGATIATGGIYGGYKILKDGADAAQSAAEQQLAMQQKQQQMVMGMLPGMIASAAPTVGELNNLDNQLQGAQRLQQMQFAQLQHDHQNYMQNPAAAQANAMMNGQEASILGPLHNQIANQRAQLVQQLAQQYGPGYASSSAGIQALNQFDQNAQMTLAQAQQSSIGQMSGIAMAGSQAMSGNMAQMGSSMNQSAGTYGQISQGLATRQMAPYQAAIGGIIGTNPSQYAGANQVSDMTMGNIGQQLLGRAIGAGTSAAMGGAPSGGGGGGTSYSFFGGGNGASGGGAPAPLTMGQMGDYPRQVGNYG